MDFYQNIIIFRRTAHTYFMLSLLFTQQLFECKSSFAPQHYTYGLPTNTNLRLLNHHGESHTNKETVSNNALDRYNLALVNRGMPRTVGFMNNHSPVIKVPILWEVDVDDLKGGKKKITEKNNKNTNKANHVRNVNVKKTQDKSSAIVGNDDTLSSHSRKIRANKISRDKTIDEKTHEEQDTLETKSPQKPNEKTKNNVVNRMDNRPKKNLRNKIDETLSNNNSTEEKSTDDSSEESWGSTDYKHLKTNTDGRPMKKSRHVVDEVVDDLGDDNVPESKGANKESDNKSSDEGPSSEWDEDSEGTTNNLQPRRKTSKPSDHNVQRLRNRATGNKTRDGKITLVILGKSKKSGLDKTVDLPEGNRPDKRVGGVHRENWGETHPSTSTRDLSKDRDKQSSNRKSKRTSDGLKNNISQDDPDDETGNLSIIHYRNYRRG